MISEHKDSVGQGSASGSSRAEFGGFQLQDTRFFLPVRLPYDLVLSSYDLVLNKGEKYSYTRLKRNGSGVRLFYIPINTTK